MASTNEIVREENKVYSKSKVLLDAPMHHCPGCSHGVAHKLVAEAIETLGIQDKAIGVSPVGCSVLAYKYINIDWQQAAHGRAPALATAIARLLPNRYVFTYQGDGDLASIGCAETIHACNRGENIVIFFVNNGIYGMTGGQMAPTTLVGMKTTTCPAGREVALAGHPLNMTEIVATLPGTSYVTRQAVHTPAAVRKCLKAFIKAFENIGKKKGTQFIEIVATCNSNWRLTPPRANDWMVESMFPVYPLGDIKDK